MFEGMHVYLLPSLTLTKRFSFTREPKKSSMLPADQNGPALMTLLSRPNRGNGPVINLNQWDMFDKA